MRIDTKSVKYVTTQDSKRQIPPQSSDRKSAIVSALAARDVEQGCRTSDLGKVKGRVISILEPIESPQAARPERRRHLTALCSGRHAAVPRAWKASILGIAAVEDPDTASRDQQVKLVVGGVPSRIDRLHNHLLSGNGSAGKGQPGGQGTRQLRRSPNHHPSLSRCAHSLVAGTAPSRGRATVDGSCGESVCKLGINSPRRVADACIGSAAVAGALGVGVEGVVAGTTGPNR